MSESLAHAGADDPLPVTLVAQTQIDLGLTEQQPLPSKYVNTRLVRLGNADHDDFDEIVVLSGPRPHHMAGFDGHPVVYKWTNGQFRRLFEPMVEFQNVYEFTCHDGGFWAGQGVNLQYCNLSDADLRDIYYAPGNLGLPVRTATVINVSGQELLLVAFVSSLHITPGPVWENFRFAAFRVDGKNLIPIAEVDNLIHAHDPSIVVGDFNQDGSDEIVVSGPSGDSSNFWFLAPKESWHFQQFASNVGAGRIFGAADVDRDGRTELVAGGYAYQGHRGLWCFEWADSTFVFDRSISVPEKLELKPLMFGNLVDDALPELIYRRGEQIEIYAFDKTSR